MTLMHTKYTSFGSCSFREEFIMYSIIKLWKIMTPQYEWFLNMDVTVQKIPIITIFKGVLDFDIWPQLYKIYGLSMTINAFWP